MEFYNIESKSKLNLYLEVGKLRNDGYHKIKTIMTKINLGDKIKIGIGKSDKLSILLKCSDKNIPTDDRNTIVKFLRNLNEIKAIKYKITIDLNKKVPSKAGLGGASGDSAAIALWLNDYLDGYYSIDELINIAKKVGSDVPFFFYNGIVEMGGIGDKLIEQYDYFEINFVVAKIKAIDIDTSYAYNNLKNNLTKSEENIMLMRKFIFNKDIGLMASALKNDFEELVFEHYKEVLSLKNKMLKYGALGACLTGSGSAVFGIAKDEKQALMIKERITSPNLEVFTCKSTV